MSTAELETHHAPEVALICVIEPDDSVRRSLEVLLSTSHYRVAGYASALAFQRSLDEQADLPQCVLISVDRWDGATRAYIKSLRDGNDLPMVVLPNHEKKANSPAIVAFVANCELYLPRYNPHTLLEMIDQTLRAAHRRVR